ncbi:Xylose isomerase domain protein TIM barrel [Syntrophobacter sp. SbD1]|nr:Xylose isomerase domain protein TIM barrel [Syntrophobacter sp. SbD1]
MRTGGFISNPMVSPVIAICNFISDTVTLKKTAIEYGFSGVDWTLKLGDIPGNQFEESRLLSDISRLDGLDVRYHCAFNGVDVGDEDERKADEAREVYEKACRIVSKADGRFMTVHLGLGRKSPVGLSWEHTVSALADLVSYAKSLGVNLCLENLASGWSSRPQLFEKLIRKTGAGITLDIGHARVCRSVQCMQFDLEDFVLPHPERVFNAHIYHEEIDDRHVPPGSLDDIRGRLDLLSSLGCTWWVLELREMAPLLETLVVVRQYLESQ